MKKSVKKVLAALLSVLLFASLFTTTAFAAKAPNQELVEAAQEVLNAAIDNFYSEVGTYYVNALNSDVLYAKAVGVINAHIVATYNEIAAKNPLLANLLFTKNGIANFSNALNDYFVGNANAALAELKLNQAAAINECTAAYLANLQAFAANVNAYFANAYN